MWRSIGGRAGAASAGAIAVLVVGAIIILSHDLGPQAQHMGLHIVAMNIVAPLLAALLVARWPKRHAQPRWLWLAALLQIVALWTSHAPMIQHVTMASPALGSIAYGALSISALLFWICLLSLPEARRWHAIPALLLTGKLVCLLAALLVFAPRALYGAGHGPAALDASSLPDC